MLGWRSRARLDVIWGLCIWSGEANKQTLCVAPAMCSSPIEISHHYTLLPCSAEMMNSLPEYNQTRVIGAET